MPPDNELIRRVIAREPGAEDAFLERFQGLVVGLGRGRFGLDPEAAEELLQMTVQQLWNDDHRALRAWRGQGRFTSYLAVIVSHLALRERRRAVQRATESDEALDQQPARERAAPSAIDRRQRRSAIDAAMAELAPRDRLLLTLRFVDGQRPRDIAQLLRLRAGTARKAIHVALARLRRRVRSRQPEWFEPPAGDGGPRAAPLTAVAPPSGDGERR